MLQVEEHMKSSVRDIIDGALEVIGNTSRTEWAQDWPCQAVLVAEFINATTLMQEAIKGGTGALKSLMDKYQEHQVWSLTQLYSVEFSKSRIAVKKCVFNKRTIKVCVSCCLRCPGTSRPSAAPDVVLVSL